MIKMSLDNSKTPVDCPHTGIHGFDRTALHLACAHGRLNAAKYLINEKQADVNKQDRDGNTPLHLATMNNSILVVNTLLEMKCEAMKKNLKGETALKIALKMEHYDIVFLIREATGIKQGDGTDGEEEVHVSTKIKTIWDAARYGDLDTLKQKLNANEISNINDSNELKFGQKRKLLHIATATGKTHVVKFLLEKGADVNVVDKFKRTPLFFAARNDEYEILKILLNAGGDPSMTDKNGATASDFAKTQEHFRCSALLDGGNGNISSRSLKNRNITIEPSSPNNKATPSKVQLKTLSDDEDAMEEKVEKELTNDGDDNNNNTVTEVKDDEKKEED